MPLQEKDNIRIVGGLTTLPMEPKQQPQLQPQVFKEIAKLESEAEGVALLEEAIAQSQALPQVQKLLGENKVPREQRKLLVDMKLVPAQENWSY